MPVSYCVNHTKVGVILAKPEQLERYLDHAKKVFIITINDKPKVKKFDNGEVEVKCCGQLNLVTS